MVAPFLGAWTLRIKREGSKGKDQKGRIKREGSKGKDQKGNRRALTSFGCLGP